MEQYLRQGLKPESKVLDIRQVDVSTGRFLEDNTPVFVITFTTQEVLLFRDRKTREVVIGAEDRVEQCNYAAVVTRVEDELENELTGGWKVIEVRFFSSSVYVRRAQMVMGTNTDGSPVGTRVSMITMTWAPLAPYPVGPPLLWSYCTSLQNCIRLASHFVLLQARTTISCYRQPPTATTTTRKKICIRIY